MKKCKKLDLDALRKNSIVAQEKLNKLPKWERDLIEYVGSFASSPETNKILKELKKKESTKNMLRFVKFYCDCGRMGSLDGKFLLNQEDWDKLQSLIGKEIYFGEVLGKHSEIIITLEKDMLEIVTDDQDFLNKAKELGVNLNSGFNPLSYYDEERDLEAADYDY